jgi:hypothetical protein
LSGYFGEEVWRTVYLCCSLTVIFLISASEVGRIIVGSLLHQPGKTNGKKRWRKGDMAGVKRESKKVGRAGAQERRLEAERRNCEAGSSFKSGPHYTLAFTWSLTPKV